MPPLKTLAGRRWLVFARYFEPDTLNSIGAANFLIGRIPVAGSSLCGFILSGTNISSFKKVSNCA